MTTERENNGYSLFGLEVQSALALPELLGSQECGSPDVTIVRGVVPDVGGKEYGLDAVGDDLILTVPDVGRFMISGGCRIVVDPLAGVPERNVRIYLLGSAFGALLHQRGMLPLHANAVEIDGRAVAFMGASGKGKSTMAAWFYDHGDRVIADDVCVIGFDGQQRAYASPGLPRLRLWAEALEVMGRDTANYQRSFVGDAGSMDKFDVPIKGSGEAPGNVILAALYLLERGDELTIVRLDGMAAAEAIIANTYRGSYLAAINGQHDHWTEAIRLVRTVPVYRATRPWQLAQLDAQCRRLRAHAAMVMGIAVDEQH